MKKILYTMIFMLIMLNTNVLAATTYYVRSDGGTSTQCTGIINAAYPGTGTAQACAYSHPAWVMGAYGTSTKWVGGDTMIIKETLADNVTQATFPIGNSMPNTVGCSVFGPLNCIMNAVPSGPDSAHPTRILGSLYASGCATKPQLYGVQRVKEMINLSGTNNFDMECVEVTDHSNCGDRVGSPVCSENYNGTSVGDYGLYGIAGAFASNLTFKNVDVHGLSDRNFLLGDLTGTNTFSHVNMDGAYQSNWDGDDRQLGGTGSISNGTVILDHVKNRFAGCSEAYPRSASFSVSDYTNCTDQNDNPPGYGDGLGTYTSGGIWIVTDSEFSHDVQDGLDLLYCQNCTSININRTLFEGNAGNQLKITTKNLNVTNSLFIANCDYFNQTGKIKNTSTFTGCRANGTPISGTPLLGSMWKISNNTAYTSTGGSGSAFIEVGDRYGTCNGTETYTYKNNVLYNANNTWTALYDGLSGSCRTAFEAATTDHSNIYNFTSAPSGTGVVTTNPQLAASISSSAASNVTSVYLTNSSPAKGASTTPIPWDTSNDYNNFTFNNDEGGLQYGSTLQKAQAGQTCTASTDCASGTCSGSGTFGVPLTCSGSCTAHGGACSGNTCCGSDTCQASVCAVPPTCGDAVIQSGETCDTTNLNGSNCILQGFTAGTLACASDCKSYNTASCTSSLVFPATPILDNFNRADQGPPASTSWTTVFGDGMKVTSNTLALATGSNGESFNIYNANAASNDQEVRVTISTLANVHIYFRSDSTSFNNYEVFYNSGTNQILLNKTVNNVQTTLATYSTVGLSAGDAIGGSAIGSTLRAYKRVSGTWTLLGNVSDSSLTSGVQAVYLGNTTARLDDFGGGNVNPITCGNGLKEGTEICDLTDLGGQTCPSQGFASGTLSCASNCQSFVTSSCVSASVCGNNVKETGEVCDGTDLNSQTCAGLGYSSGSLTCNSGCLSFNTSSCVSSAGGIKGGVTLK